MTTKEGKRQAAERASAAADLGIYLSDILDRQLEAGAKRFFREPEHFPALARTVSGKLFERMERWKSRLEGKPNVKQGETAAEERAKPLELKALESELTRRVNQAVQRETAK